MTRMPDAVESEVVAGPGVEGARRATALQCHLQGLDDQMPIVDGADRPANEEARVEVEQGRQVELTAAPDHTLRRVRDPALVGCVGDEIPVEHVRRDRLVMRAHRRARESLPGAGAQALEPHQSHHPLAADRLALLPQVLVHAGAAISPPARRMRGPHQHPQLLVPSRMRRDRPVPPRVEPARRDLQHPTHRAYAEGGLLRLDEREPYTWSLAKKAAAFFRISRSVRSVRTSLRSRRTCPGVLAIAQPLIVTESRTERNLRSFPRQYARLLDALGAAGHDVVVLSGDVHFGRIARVALGNAGARLIEIISSPLSNLTGLNGIATNVARADPANFPPAADAATLAWPSRPVDYFTDGGRRGRFFVGSRRGWPLSAYPKRRTREHFMTVSFHRLPDGGVELTAEAWFVRRRTGSDRLPAREFAEPFRITLR